MNKRSGRAVALIITIVIVILIAFIFGTVVGFNVAVRNIGECKPIDCNILGATKADNLTACEVCPGSVLRIGAG